VQAARGAGLQGGAQPSQVYLRTRTHEKSCVIA
jgi:hypothetical protein